MAIVASGRSSQLEVDVNARKRAGNATLLAFEQAEFLEDRHVLMNELHVPFHLPRDP